MTPKAVLDSLELPGWATALLAVALSLLLAILLRFFLERLASRLAKNSASAARVVDVLAVALRLPLTLLLFLAGVRLALEFASLPARWAWLPGKAVALLTAVVATYAFGTALLSLVREFAKTSARLSPITGFLSGVIRGVVLLLGLLVALKSVGVSITPLLASLGVGSVAVALALQETLGNLFAGVALLADH
ncbi:MAG TPA: mechanosensitive ion channel family protein, partial [Thermoanaerobaculia bacterium]|nr:mechanosensitive ion channel family protein [Thermoanaerobaculia bacterium]